MPHVSQLSPTVGTVDLDQMLTTLAAQAPLPPFAPEALAFVADLSRAIGKAGRGRPELQALAYWMRKAELTRLAESFAGLESESSVRVPRGTVFHVPPANVDTLFVYSWVLALLTGNRNLVRMSSRVLAHENLLIRVINEVLAEHPEVAARSVMVTYGHEQSITDALSLSADLRIIWGGDATVNVIRCAPLQPWARDLTFPDRFSLAAISSPAYAALSEAERDELANRFYNDAYWFDQMGCSSPRVVLWAGEPHDDDFFTRVSRVIAHKHYEVEIATAVAKLVYSLGSIIERDVTRYGTHGNELSVLQVNEFPEVRGEFCGGGLFFSWQVEGLRALEPHLQRKDQTLSYFGFAPAELREFARHANGRGIDRFVPIGQALDFNRVWDGVDLVAECTRIVTVN